MSKFEVGQIWLTRDGAFKYQILHTNAPNETFPLIALNTTSGTPDTFTKEGKFGYASKNPRDLVKQEGLPEHPKAEFLRALADGRSIEIFDFDGIWKALDPFDNDTIYDALEGRHMWRFAD